MSTLDVTDAPRGRLRDVGLATMLKSGPGVITLIWTFIVASPNQSWNWFASATILHWKLWVPGVVGAVMLKVKLYVFPGGTVAVGAMLTLFSPQIVLSWGFCEPRR